MERQQRVRPRNAVDIDLGVPGGALVHAHTEPLAAEEVGEHLVGEAEVLGVRAARQMTGYGEPGEEGGPDQGYEGHAENVRANGYRLQASPQCRHDAGGSDEYSCSRNRW